ncbi:MAG: hypothetical protein A2494_04205 [Candidatus Lloydbacteria bacterium RIFOXYC12_FULL_46_25]|uniref:Uncharacterized protein n=1 Tax=Candidatus Lloydbacteria bacterium RIFOXYC12_FULL_46_25 TaxID=1798670 RepID=A0A1G2DUQ1_9BACT|nr:MAG: hypothetical protein A2494_04205 [Candidatus Lloydbacteria bacterium RIFOXYC12_FULL_46_25]
MDRKSTIIIAGILITSIAFILFVALSKTTIDTNESDVENVSTTEWANTPAEFSSTSPISSKIVVTAKHAYRNGAHIIAGEIPLPSPCHILESTGSASADKTHVFVELAASVKTGEMCAQVITPARFKVSVKANKNATISGTLDGKEIVLNLIEAGPDENLDNFDLYIKG